MGACPCAAWLDVLLYVFVFAADLLEVCAPDRLPDDAPDILESSAEPIETVRFFPRLSRVVGVPDDMLVFGFVFLLPKIAGIAIFYSFSFVFSKKSAAEAICLLPRFFFAEISFF